MLYLIGTGIKEGDITLRAIKVLKKVKKIYLDSYTIPLTENIKRNISFIEKLVKKKIIFADREFVEEKLEKIAKKEDIALLVIGDPLFATTHYYQFKDIIKEVIHSSSILNYAWEIGLSPYKFGRIITIPHPSKGIFPSIIEEAKKNASLDLHTLVLLDTEPALDYKTALEHYSQLKKFRYIIAFSVKERLYKAVVKPFNEELKVKPPHSIILTNSLSSYEEEFVLKRI